ncbi:MAG TPA: 6-phosphogluconolactonase, partial [Streptosporangiaceae bacterium]|nr:6-phosphogluconolactonase [Streptosporangiaceae bacterium]
MSVPEVIVHRDARLLAQAVAARLVTRLVDAVAARGTASVVLTGGGIGTKVLEELAAAPARDAVDWRRLDIWWGDERFVPAGHPDRNETG